MPEGWFLLSRWSTVFDWAEDGGRELFPIQPTYTDAVVLDATEVTNAQWLAFVADGGGTAPPDECSCDQVEDGIRYFGEVSGWRDGGFDPARANHPVVCVTRREAISYCASRGGRLPTVLEYMKALRGLYPSMQPYPWGEYPPLYPDPGSPGMYPAGFHEDYLAVGYRSPGWILNTVPVASRSLGRARSGAFDLTGNVAEYTFECAEQLAELYGANVDPLIRPSRGASRQECVQGPIVVGENWYSESGMTLAATGTLSAYVFNQFPQYVGNPSCQAANRGPLCGIDLSWQVFGTTDCNPLTPTELKNDRRSWSVGFRCAYDLP